MKKVLFGVIILLIITSMGLSACTSEPAATTTTAPLGTTTAPPPVTTTAVVGAVKLKVACTSPITTPPGIALDAAMKKLDKDSGGRIQHLGFYSNSLFTADEGFRSIQTGVGDISDLYTLGYPGQLAMHNLLQLPGLLWPDNPKALEIYNQLSKQIPEIGQEWTGVKLITYAFYGTPTMISDTKKLYKTFADFKGTKIIGSGVQGDFWNACGGTAISVPFQDSFTSLNSGLVTATVGSMGWQKASGTVDVLKFRTTFGGQNIMNSTSALIMNPGSYNKLAPDLQKLIDNIGPYYADIRGKSETDVEAAEVAKLKAANASFFDLPLTEIKKFTDAGLPLHSSYIKTYASATKPVQLEFDTLQKLLAAAAK